MMADVDGSSGIAWRLLATLEGGTLLLAISALLAYTAKSRYVKKRRQRVLNNVIIPDIITPLGRDIKQRLEARGCVVHTNVSGNRTILTQVDAIVIIGAARSYGLDGISNLVTEDVYYNLNLLESLSPLVKRGGCIAWACIGTSDDGYDMANVAYDAVLRTSLQHMAKICHCESIWVGRCATEEQTADKLLSTLYPCLVQANYGFSFRNAANKISKFIDRWWKMIT